MNDLRRASGDVDGLPREVAFRVGEDKFLKRSSYCLKGLISRRYSAERRVFCRGLRWLIFVFLARYFCERRGDLIF